MIKSLVLVLLVFVLNINLWNKAFAAAPNIQGSVEINVEALINELEADGIVHRIDSEKNTRRRLEELMERKRAMRELEDFDDYDI